MKWIGVLFAVFVAGSTFAQSAVSAICRNGQTFVSFQDSQKQWACTAWLVGESPVLVDNCPIPALLTSMTIRRPLQFRPLTGAPVSWRVRNASTGAVLQSGNSTVKPNGLVDITNFFVTRAPLRCRIEVSLKPIQFLVP